MKKLTAFLSVIIMLSSITSCKPDNQTSEETKQPQNITAEKLSDVAYKRSISELPDELRQIYRLDSYDGGNSFMILGAADVVPAFYKADSELKNVERLDIPEFSIGASYDIDTADDGSIIAVVNEVDYGDLPDPDPSAEDYDADLYEEAAEYSIVVNKFSPDGKLVSSNEIKDIYSITPPENVMITGVYCFDGENLAACINNVYYCIGVDGKLKGEIKAASDEMEISQLGKDSEGNIVCAVESGEDKLKICRVDMENAKTEDAEIEYNFSETVINKIIPGTGDYTMFITSRTTIYGIRREDASIEPLFSIEKSGLNPNLVSDYFMDSDGNFAVIENLSDKYEVRLRKYTECDPDELANLPVLTVGMVYFDWDISDEFVADFNDSQSDYRVEIKYYNEYSTQENPDGGEEQLSKELISGEAPDIIMVDNYSDYMKLEDKGVYADLYEFMENDEDLNKDDIIPNIREMMETDGHLYSFPNTFSISTVIAKTEHVGEKENWTIDEYLDARRNLPEKMEPEINNESKMSRLLDFNLGMFIEREKAECNFDSDEFIKLLEYCDEAPYDPETEEYHESSDEELIKEALKYIEDRALLYPTYWSGYDTYYYDIYGTFDGAPVTRVGKPSLDGKGTTVSIGGGYAINANSDKKELAWEFLKQFYTDEFYTSDHNWTSFAVTQSGLDAQGEYVKTKVRYASQPDYTGFYYQLGGVESYRIGGFNDEQVEDVKEIIYSLDKEMPYISWWERDIVVEEADRFFKGEITAEKCSEVIQSRMSLSLAERK